MTRKKESEGGKSFVGFYTEPYIKNKLRAVAKLRGCTVTDLMVALCEQAEILILFTDLAGQRPR